MMNVLLVLCTHFPRHCLLLSNFRSLPDVIMGINVNAQVVQARVRGLAVTCSRLSVFLCLFDIFPTHFNWLRDMYKHSFAQPRAEDDYLPVAAREQRITAVYWCGFLPLISAAELSYAD